MNSQIGNQLADQRLVDQVLNGDTQAFAEIIKNTEGLVAQIVFKMIPNIEDRKDMAQDIYLKAFHKLSGFRFQSKLSTWIGQIAYNNCLSWLEKKKLIFPGPSLESEEAHRETSFSNETETTISRKELSGILHFQISQLPPVHQTLLILYHQEELSYSEMAQITGLPEGTVKSYLFRARKMLKENLLTKYKREAL